jgi:hypothetical protein
VRVAWGRAQSRVFGDAGFSVEDLVFAHLLPQHLAADAQVLRGVLALPVVDLQRGDDAVALAAVPALAVAVAVERDTAAIATAPAVPLGQDGPVSACRA